MRRRTAVLASAILAIGGFGIADPLLSVSLGQQQQNTGQSSGQINRNSGQSIGTGSQSNNNNATGANATGDRQGANANRGNTQAELKGVQSLFAEATDAAVMRDGLMRLSALVAPEMGGAATSGATGLNHTGKSTPGSTGATHSGASGAGTSSGTSGSGTSSGTSGNTGTSGSGLSSSGASGTSSGTASRSGTGTTGSGTAGSNNGVGAAGGNAGLASSRTGQGNADTHKLNQLVDQFNRDWKQKYNRDFRISDPSLVFADITANDIMAGQAQPAGEHLQGSGTNNGTSGTSGSTSGTHGASGTSSGTSGRTSTSGSSGASGAAGSSGQSSSGAGSASNRTSGTSGAGLTSGTNMMGHEMTVNVPPVQGSQAVTVRLVRMGQDSFRFASSTGMVDQQRLASALETHIKQVMDQKDKWPTDAAQAQRLVTQHVLMAVSEACNSGGENAQPAGLHLQGHNGANNTSNAPGPPALARRPARVALARAALPVPTAPAASTMV